MSEVNEVGRKNVCVPSGMLETIIRVLRTRIERLIFDDRFEGSKMTGSVDVIQWFLSWHSDIRRNYVPWDQSRVSSYGKAWFVLPEHAALKVDFDWWGLFLVPASCSCLTCKPIAGDLLVLSKLTPKQLLRSFLLLNKALNSSRILSL